MPYIYITKRKKKTYWVVLFKILYHYISNKIVKLWLCPYFWSIVDLTSYSTRASNKLLLHTYMSANSNIVLTLSS